MKHSVFAAILLMASPAIAEDDKNGLSRMERGAQLFMEGILKELEPALEGLEGFGPQMRSFLEEMGPALGALMEQVQDWSAYHPPEILPNGDIIMRRKTQPEDRGEDSQIDI